MKERLFFAIAFLLLSCFTLPLRASKESGEAKAEETNKRSNLLALLLIGLLLLTVLIIWFLKVKRIRFVHETGLCLVFGIIAGAILRYSGSGIHGKAVFDPEIFFYVLLPPIIFYAGYDMKKRYFFRNIGAILTYAFIGTIVSFIVFAAMLYGFVSAFSTTDEDGTVQTDYPGFRFQDCLLFGSLIAATDPVTILAIFHDLNVEVDLYAIVFGESVMNDAVAIVLYRSIQSYSNTNFTGASFFEALGIFLGVFLGSFVLGAAMALLTALLTKLTKIGNFPRLETVLFILMSYSTFLIAEALGLTGIVTVLFCGMVQAHYTFNNLTEQSQLLTREIFGLLNFLSENFIFCYMGLSVFAFEGHQWDGGFICWTFFACAISRACNIYPLSFILNLKRSTPIPYNSQHMLWWGGLRGAVAFALAIRNTTSGPRKLMLSSVLVVAIVTVIVNGGLTTWVLTKLGIRVGMVTELQDAAVVSSDSNDGATAPTNNEQTGGDAAGGDESLLPHGGRSWVARKWHAFDVNYMKPFFTTRAGPVNVNFPRCFCCHAVNSCCDVQTTSTIADDDAYQNRLDNVAVPSMKRLMTYL